MPTTSPNQPFELPRTGTVSCKVCLLPMNPLYPHPSCVRELEIRANERLRETERKILLEKQEREAEKERNRPRTKAELEVKISEAQAVQWRIQGQCERRMQQLKDQAAYYRTNGEYCKYQ